MDQQGSRGDEGMHRSNAILFALLCTATLAAEGLAGVPDPRTSRLDRILVGDSSGWPLRAGPTADPGVGFVVCPRTDTGSFPSWWTVTLDFSHTNLRLYSEQESGATLDCATRTITKGISRPAGEAIFAPRLGGFANGATVEVWSVGVFLGQVPARSTDLDALGATTNSA